MKFLLTCFYTFHCRGFYKNATENPQITKEISTLAKHSFIFYNSPGVAAFLSDRGSGTEEKGMTGRLK